MLTKVEEEELQKEELITVIVDKKEVQINPGFITYVLMEGNYACIHLSDSSVYRSRMTLGELEKLLGTDFIKIKRGCIVSAKAVHSVTDTVNLSNGESLVYVVRKKDYILEKLYNEQRAMIQSFNDECKLNTQKSYNKHYQLFDEAPFAFTDIEMVFDEGCHAVDWVFRYGNPALAKLEKMPLDKLIGSRFGSIFPNMDEKWLKSYERVAVYGEMLKIVDYSPEIDTYLDIICFPTFKGHCGCIMFDVAQIKPFRKTSDTEKAFALFFERLMNG